MILQIVSKYLIRNPKTSCDVSISDLTLICHFECSRWSSLQILGLKGVKISQNGQNLALRVANIMVLLILSRLFD